MLKTIAILTVVIGSIAGSTLLYNSHVSGMEAEKEADRGAAAFVEAFNERFSDGIPQPLIRYATLTKVSKLTNFGTVYMDYTLVNYGWYTVFLAINDLTKIEGDKLDRRVGADYVLVTIDLQRKDCLDKTRNMIMNMGTTFVHTYNDAYGEEVLIVATRSLSENRG